MKCSICRKKLDLDLLPEMNLCFNCLSSVSLCSTFLDYLTHRTMNRRAYTKKQIEKILEKALEKI